MKKTYNKLVRDKIPEIIRADGLEPSMRILDDDEYLAELVKKLREELAEFESDQSLEELADIAEVVLALADVLGGRAELEKTRKEKSAKRGGFKKKIYLENVG